MRVRWWGSLAALVVALLAGQRAAGAPGVADADMVCKTVPNRKEPVCMPRANADLAKRFNQTMVTAIARAEMTPDFCADIARRSAGKRNLGPQAAWALHPGQAQDLQLHLAYLAVLRSPSDDAGMHASDALLGLVARRSIPEQWGPTYFQQALDADLLQGDPRAIVNSLLMLAGSFIRARDFATADAHLANAGQRAAGDAEARAAVLANQGVVSALMGDPARAIEQTKHAVALYRRLHDDNPRSDAEIAAGCVAMLPLDEARRALAARSVRTGLEATLINLGAMQAQLGQFDQSILALEQAIALHAAAGQRGAGAPLQAMVAVLQRARRPEGDRQNVVERAARSGPSLLLALSATYARGVALNADAGAGADMRGNPSPATLLPPRMAALQAEAMGASDTLRAAWAQMQRTAGDLRQTELAIYYGKRAVNQIQQQRARMATMSREARKTFSAASRGIHEALAQALLDSDRLEEAEHALLLFHQDDLASYGSARGVMPLNQAEHALQDRDIALAARWRAAAAHREAAISREPGLRVVAAEEIDRLFDGSVELIVNTLRDMEPLHALREKLNPLGGPRGVDVTMDAHASAIESVLQSLTCNGAGNAAPAWPAPPVTWEVKCSQIALAAVEAAAGAQGDPLVARLRTDPGTLTDADAAPLQRSFRALASNEASPAAAALHYLVTEHRLYILVVTPAGREVVRADIGRAALAKLIEDFVRAVRTDGSDVQPTARALHQVLIQPAARLLADVSLLHLVPDGDLRVAPFAALHDGQSWLVERHALVLGIPSAPRAGETRRSWTIAGLGRAAPAPGFEALPGVGQELRALVRGPSRDDPGVMDGIVRLDRAFSESALREALGGRFAVVHIASHFVLRTDDPGNSFLLLGDDTRLTLQALRAGYRFDGVELVTLSACETGLDASNLYGQEFEGLLAVLRNQGAASVMASLWRVADDSTSLFMRRFYTVHQQRGLSRAQALRAAQRELIDGSAGPPAPARTSEEPAVQRDIVRPGAPSRRGPLRPADPARPHAHPYHWAPFVLSGEAS